MKNTPNSPAAKKRRPRAKNLLRQWGSWILAGFLAVVGINFVQRALAGDPQDIPTAGGLEWRTDYQAALAESAETGLPLLLRFTASWCAPCRVMDQVVWPQDQVHQAIEGHVIPVALDIDQREVQGVAREAGVRGVPTLLLVDQNGQEIDRRGFVRPGQLVKFLEQTK